MNQTEREETTRAVEQFLNESLERILLSNPVNPQQPVSYTHLTLPTIRLV